MTPFCPPPGYATGTKGGSSFYLHLTDMKNFLRYVLIWKQRTKSCHCYFVVCADGCSSARTAGKWLKPGWIVCDLELRNWYLLFQFKYWNLTWSLLTKEGVLSVASQMDYFKTIPFWKRSSIPKMPVCVWAWVVFAGKMEMKTINYWGSAGVLASTNRRIGRVWVPPIEDIWWEDLTASVWTLGSHGNSIYLHF